ncbi:MAG: hypothetical protein IJR91_00515 [Ruminococcus sp.]|nr:hypothetical protein [Ruminococcus sp.]
MLLYEYPPKLNRIQRQQKAVNDLAEHRKMRKGLYRNLIIGCVIGVVGIFVPVMIVRILLWLIAAANIAVALLLYRFSALSRDTECFTRIYDDHIEHKQGSLLSKKYLTVTLMYSDIERSEQTPQGAVVFYLKEDAAPSLKGDAAKAEAELSRHRLTLSFQDTKAKLYLINELHDRIKYPKKNYNVIEDEEDEDDLWDPLHKHGL